MKTRQKLYVAAAALLAVSMVGAGEHCVFCGTSGNDGCILKHGTLRGTFP